MRPLSALRLLPISLAILVCFLSTFSVYSQVVPDPKTPEIQEESGDASLALQGFKIADGIKGSLFAAEPLFANPVAFYVDDKGRVFVCESFRQEIGVVDNRSYDDTWVDADLASQTVDDRREYHERLLGDLIQAFTEQDDQLRLLIDTNQDGKADESYVFANRFNDIVDGTGAGVLEYKGNVYYTCIPSLYLMRDEDGDFKADGREVLQTGYGVRVAFRGHDMHGLVIGPDGRLYFSIGDRGANVDTDDGKIINVESGSVFRCELDGSKLELFATGLRNPQELAFDAHGNLFTGDNNSDSGDQARWVYVVEGGDSGWRMAYQYLPDRGPFNREKIWYPLHPGQPAYIVPPIANISDGPSGLDYYPGTGFGDRFKNTFLLCDFRGTASQSGIRSIRNEADGAFFRIAEDDQPFWQILATDVQFGPDGGVYISDWVNGWSGEGKGRIYRFVSEEHHDSALVREVSQILASNIAETAVSTLAEYLRHPDRRIRLKAQLELATRGEFESLKQAAVQGSSQLEVLHGMWGLDHLARLRPEKRQLAVETWVSLATHTDPEIRAHAVRLLGEFADASLTSLILAKLADESPRVQYFAMVSARKLGLSEALGPVIDLLSENAGQDPILRHGGIMALAALANDDELAAIKEHASMHVRLAAVVALRRSASERVAEFLSDSSPEVVVEAAIAIHDEPILEAMPQLAQLIDNVGDRDALVRRVLNANFRLGTEETAKSLAQYAADGDNPQKMRVEALAMLGDWQSPNGRDRVLGMWRPLPDRDPQVVRKAISPLIENFVKADTSLQLKIGELAGQLDLQAAAPILRSLLTDEQVAARERADALLALVGLNAASQAELELALKDPETIVRAAALRVLRQVMPDTADEKLAQAAFTGQPRERQVAIESLGANPQPHPKLIEVLTQWAEGKLPPEVDLEALEAAEKLGQDVRIKAILAKVNSSRDASKPSDMYREALYGGEVDEGRKVFFEKVAVSCVRCHKVAGVGGEVGPELTSIGREKDRRYLLESIIEPNKVIAKGFESAILLDMDGNVHNGVVREENDESITLIDAEGNISSFDKDDIEARNPAKSAMPADLINSLSKNELRDLIEYLSSLDGSQQPVEREVQ